MIESVAALVVACTEVMDTNDAILFDWTDPDDLPGPAVKSWALSFGIWNEFLSGDLFMDVDGKGNAVQLELSLKGNEVDNRIMVPWEGSPGVDVILPDGQQVSATEERAIEYLQRASEYVRNAPPTEYIDPNLIDEAPFANPEEAALFAEAEAHDTVEEIRETTSGTVDDLPDHPPLIY